MRLAYEEQGTGPVVVLLHGFPLDRSMWLEQIKALRDRYRVIVPDLRGHGESHAPEGTYSMAAMAEDVRELLEALKITGPIVLGGLSMGGYVSLAFYKAYPDRVRALILMDTKAAADAPDVAQKRLATAQAVLDADSAGPVVEPMICRLFGATTKSNHAERIAPMRERMERMSPWGVAGASRGMAARVDRRSELASIRVPTLVLVGEEDEITPVSTAEEMAKAIPKAELVVIPRAGHLSPWENPADANSALDRFLKTLDQPSASQQTTVGRGGSQAKIS
jgi:pimeloyl-ACP methyl ester carboxylesterase